MKSVEELRNTLDNNGFQQAVAILKEVAGPSFSNIQDSESDGRRFAWYAGYRDAFNDLEKLTKLPEDNKGNITSFNEWNHIS